MQLCIPVELPGLDDAVKALYQEGALILVGDFFYEIHAANPINLNGVDYAELTLHALPTDVVRKKPRTSAPSLSSPSTKRP